MESSLLEKIARLSQQVEELQAEKQRMLDEGSQRSFPSDREARLMKTRNGFVPAYNIQSVVDSQHHLIGAMQVTDHPNDFEDLQPSIHAMQEDLQVEVSQVVADTGYANEEQILALEEEGKVIAVPFNEGDHSPKEDREHGIFFTYDADNDYYICSQEKILPIKDRQVRKHGKIYRKYQGRDCKGCPLIKFCTTSKKGLSRFLAGIIFYTREVLLTSHYEKRLFEHASQPRVACADIRLLSYLWSRTNLSRDSYQSG